MACLLECELHLVDVYLRVPHRRAVRLLNQTLLPTKFEWGRVRLPPISNAVGVWGEVS